MTALPGRLVAALADRYRIERELGQGGMATVYLAHDLRHEREVAIKVLHPDLGATLGSDRFLTEIRTTARLQHPHILPLLDSGEANGLLYYVMPRVMGETLRARLDKERQLPVEDAVRVARETADALGYAHGHGVIHRDIKPENILLQGGHALVADFGIALAVQQAGGARLTQTGLSLGTPQYMSPEQAMGERTVDARSDIYSLGAVAYEMLTGDPPFTGSSVQAIVAKIMTERPTPIRALRDTVPAHVEHAVLKSLAKLPADRHASAESFATALAGTGYAEPEPAAARRAGVPRRKTHDARLLAIMAIITVAALAFAIWTWRSQERPAGTSRLTLLFEDYYEESEEGPVLSPDDRTFLISSKTHLLLRHVSSAESQPILDATGAWAASFSPDGESISYATGFPGDLNVADLATKSVRTIVHDSALGYGTHWSDDGWIYYTTSLGRAIARVRPGGGEPELVARTDSAQSDLVFRMPHALPDGRGLLFTRWGRQAAPEIIHLDLRSGRTRVVIGGLAAWYVRSGHLVVARPEGQLSVMRFSLKAGEVRSRAVDLERGFRVATGGRPIVEVSRSGSIIYTRAEASDQLIRVTRGGQPSIVDPGMRGLFRSLALSPDGARAAVAVMTGGRGEVWIKSLDDGPFTRAATAGTYAYRMFWSPDGRSIGFISDLEGLPRAFSASAEGPGAVTPLPMAGRSVDEGTWTSDGRWLVVRAGSGSGRDIYGIPMDGDTTPVPLAVTEVEEYSPIVSPDRRWLAYGTEESGREEIFVRPFGSPDDRRHQVSLAGGVEPLWSHSGRELFYRDASDNLIAVTIAPGDEFRVLSRRVLFSTAGYRSDIRHRVYAVSPDDQSFYFIQRSTRGQAGVVVVQNWLEEVERQLST